MTSIAKDGQIDVSIRTAGRRTLTRRTFRESVWVSVSVVDGPSPPNDNMVYLPLGTRAAGHLKLPSTCAARDWAAGVLLHAVVVTAFFSLMCFGQGS